MNDSIFNTITAVALMCTGHFHGLLSNDLMPDKGTWDAGFEQCAVVIKALAAEQTRRDEVKAAKRVSDDKARVVNALAALHGKLFTPEPSPGIFVHADTITTPLWVTDNPSCTISAE